MPLVLTIDLETSLSLGGGLAASCGRRAGFTIADKKPITSGTAKPKGTKNRGEKRKVEPSTLELTQVNFGEGNKARCTFLTAQIAPTFNLPLPYPPQISSGENKDQGIASKEVGPLPWWAVVPPVRGEGSEHQKEQSKTQHKSPLFPSKPCGAHLVKHAGLGALSSL